MVQVCNFQLFITLEHRYFSISIFTKHSPGLEFHLIVKFISLADLKTEKHRFALEYVTSEEMVLTSEEW